MRSIRAWQSGISAVALLEVSGLDVRFATPRGDLRAVQGLTFAVDAGETVAIVGESGCGKSVTAMSVLRLVPEPPGRVQGAIRLNGRDLLTLSEREMRTLRGRDIGMVFQEPMTSLNPVLTVGRQIGETLRVHEGLSARAASTRAVEMLALVGIPAPERRIGEYPHQLSGGMQQRVAISQALLMNPPVLLLDEAFSALDPSTRASLQEQLREVWLESKPTVVFVTHNTSEALLLGTRLILLRRHSESRAGETNLALDMQIPPSTLPLSMRARSAEFQELLEHVKELAYKSSSMNKDDANADASADEATPA